MSFQQAQPTQTNGHPALAKWPLKRVICELVGGCEKLSMLA
nr:hypothetical protein [Amylibacter sp.]